MEQKLDMELSDIQKLIDKKLQSSHKSLTENEAKKIFNLFDITVEIGRASCRERV